MTSLNIEDIAHKKKVNTKYTPNSYRIFCEDIGNDSVDRDQTQAPPLYTQPMIIPAQAIEDRNFPHAGRSANFLRENAYTLNEPVNKISSKNVSREAEKRWWDWSEHQSNLNQQTSLGAVNPHGDSENFKTTYQKNHGILRNPIQPNVKVENTVSRHSFNPSNNITQGIVPINDLNSFSNGNVQRVFVDKMSFEHQYDARQDSNYPNRGKRQGAFVIEQIEPKPVLGTKIIADAHKGSSVWDLMHPNEEAKGNHPPSSFIHPRAVQNQELLKNQRRDPIGYFEDNKFGGSMGSNLTNMNPAPTFNQNLKANTQEAAWAASSKGSFNGQNSDQLLEHALMYQNPILANGNGHQN